MRRPRLIAALVLASMGLVSATRLPAQGNASLRDEMKVRQHQEASALKAQHRLEKESAKREPLSKAQRKQMRKTMKQESRQMRRAHKAQWRNLKAQDRWKKQHAKEEQAIPNS